MEPLGAMITNPALAALGLSGISCNIFNGLFFTSMFQGQQRSFLPRTCEMLTIRFGQGSLYLTFEQFCLMIQSLPRLLLRVQCRWHMKQLFRLDAVTMKTI